MLLSLAHAGLIGEWVSTEFPTVLDGRFAFSCIFFFHSGTLRF